MSDTTPGAAAEQAEQTGDSRPECVPADPIRRLLAAGPAAAALCRPPVSGEADTSAEDDARHPDAA